jgi:Bacteriocin-protection, YdeI or OmpD-Associated/Domain of unknown function (DUF1905)
MRFQARIEQSGKTATGIRVPPEVVDALGAGKRPAVRVTINEYTYRSTLGVMGGVTMLPLSADHRQGAGVAAGDDVDIELVLDTEPREVAVPPDLAAALEKDGDAQRVFNTLSYSAKQRHVLSVEGAKSPETRQRRIEAVIASLHKDFGAHETG